MLQYDGYAFRVGRSCAVDRSYNIPLQITVVHCITSHVELTCSAESLLLYGVLSLLHMHLFVQVCSLAGAAPIYSHPQAWFRRVRICYYYPFTTPPPQCLSNLSPTLFLLMVKCPMHQDGRRPYDGRGCSLKGVSNTPATCACLDFSRKWTSSGNEIIQNEYPKKHATEQADTA